MASGANWQSEPLQTIALPKPGEFIHKIQRPANALKLL
jgi:hypothetical protein